jgi:hypothetical protein
MTDGTNVWHGGSISGSFPFLKSRRRQSDACPKGFDPMLEQGRRSQELIKHEVMVCIFYTVLSPSHI